VVNNLKFCILIDNTSDKDLLTEHGFSVWVECDGKTILFDTGQNTDDSGILFKNAKSLGCDLTTVDTLVLSHGHYDHTGSVSQLLAVNPKVNVVCHPNALMEERYSIYPDKEPRQIAMPEKDRNALRLHPAHQLHLLTESTLLFPDIGFSGAIPRQHPLEDTGGPFFTDKHKREPDTIYDDISLWFETSQGLVILTGCCHSGIMNTVQHIQNVTGKQEIRAVVGGLHLNRASEQRLQATRDAFVKWKPQVIVPCHCTGEIAINHLKEVTPDLFMAGGSGACIAFGSGSH
jgi:7,8-dihydropterin-6-yl-methyl-4-(beta-D-ribofuranosyl)aminobenzene 5'-phosphate synthase